MKVRLHDPRCVTISREVFMEGLGEKQRQQVESLAAIEELVSYIQCHPDCPLRKSAPTKFSFRANRP